MCTNVTDKFTMASIVSNMVKQYHCIVWCHSDQFDKSKWYEMLIHCRYCCSLFVAKVKSQTWSVRIRCIYWFIIFRVSFSNAKHTFFLSIKTNAFSVTSESWRKSNINRIAGGLFNHAPKSKQTTEWETILCIMKYCSITEWKCSQKTEMRMYYMVQNWSIYTIGFCCWSWYRYAKCLECSE